MGKIMGSWSHMRKYLEQEMLADSLRGRIRYGCTTYPGMDGCHIFDVHADGKQLKRFSLETVNSYFITAGYKSGDSYWDGFWYLLNEIPVTARTEYTDDEFCNALVNYRSQPIAASIVSSDPIVRMFAILDRRVGKRTLQTLVKTIDMQPDWLQQFYILRLNAENISKG